MAVKLLLANTVTKVLSRDINVYHVPALVPTVATEGISSFHRLHQTTD